MTVTCTCDTNGNRESRTYANGTRTAYTYNLANQVTRVENRKGAETPLSSYDYAYDMAGNQVSKTDHNDKSIADTDGGAGRLTNETEMLSGRTVFSVASVFFIRLRELGIVTRHDSISPVKWN